jgi:hypothetical protein
VVLENNTAETSVPPVPKANAGAALAAKRLLHLAGLFVVAMAYMGYNW